MPELPEVETTRLGITPYIKGQTITGVVVRNRQLRWPVPSGLKKILVGRVINLIERRAKYLLLKCDQGCLILHLGMSGSLRIITDAAPPQKHDHIDLEFGSGMILRFRDPRKFGSVHWTKADPAAHALLAGLGPEPFGDEFNNEYLHEKSRGRRQSIKTFIMDSRIVAGIGNIYANEALFLSGIHPARQAGRISGQRYGRLVPAIRDVLLKSIHAGGTTLRDFASGEGQPGYFALELAVYDRQGEPCLNCGSPVRHSVIGQRSTYYCPKCQH